jgi:hypothetical protein
VLGRVDNDGRPAMGFVSIGMLDIRFGVVIRPACGTDARGKSKSCAKT